MDNLDKLQERIENISFDDLKKYMEKDVKCIQEKKKKICGALLIVLIVLLSLTPLFVIAFGVLALTYIPVLLIAILLVRVAIEISLRLQNRSLIKAMQNSKIDIVYLINDIRNDRLSDIDDIAERLAQVKNGILYNMTKVSVHIRANRYDKYTSIRDIYHNYIIALDAYGSDIMSDIEKVKKQ